MAQNIILDTDIGDNIDDALALVLALHSPEINLLGVTTVFRNAPRRAKLAEHLLHAFGHADVPVVAGVSKPLLEAFDPQMGRQFEILDDDIWEDRRHAVDFIIETARVDEEPDGENLLTLVAIGPLTNIAAALVREPELVSRCRVVLMGGFAQADYAEWNIKCDPEAAAIVFNSGIEISMIGLDVTLQTNLSAEQIALFANATTPTTQLLAQFIELWQSETKRTELTLHDPLALMTIWDDCVRFEDKRIEVALCGEDRGKTLVVEGEPNARVAVEVNAEIAVERFLNRVLK
ncbi:MAG TPA: nucleoside hydrolase [Abditibacteriaceae bacterium]|jgi:inosine-uridine nucleoside N-ribohydrolase